MNKISDFQIPDLLTVAKCRLAYCLEIINFLKEEDYELDNSFPTDSFYINLYNMSFHESLMIVVGLLKNPDRNDQRVINFWNEPKLTNKAAINILKGITQEQTFINLALMRDQIIAHQDVSNRSNLFPRDRMFGRVSQSYVLGLKEILEKCIKVYCICNPSFTDKYINDGGATVEIKTMLEKAKPTLKKLLTKHVI